MYWTYLMWAKDPLVLAMQQVMKTNEEHVATARAKNPPEKYVAPLPLHVIAWVEVVDTLKTIAGLEPLQDYAAEIRNNTALVGDAVLYFRKQEPKDKSKMKLLVAILPGTSASVAWTLIERYLTTNGAEKKQGTAPRNGRDRKILSQLRKLGKLKGDRKEKDDTGDMDDD